jgi:type IV secretory pathway VirB10-like protein
MPKDRAPFLLAVFAAVAMHALFLAWAGYFPFQSPINPNTPSAKEEVLFMEVVAPPPDPLPPQPVPPTQAPKPNPAPVLPTPPNNAWTAPVAAQPPASMDAPAAPTAEEWAFAAKYTLKNSKGYRHSWAKQVRSLMGTAIEGPDQGMVRFRVGAADDWVRLHALRRGEPAHTALSAALVDALRRPIA